MSLYVSWPGAASLPAGAATVEFGPTLVRFRVRGSAGGNDNRELYVPNLCGPIDEAKSKLLTKEDRFFSFRCCLCAYLCKSRYFSSPVI